MDQELFGRVLAHEFDLPPGPLDAVAVLNTQTERIERRWHEACQLGRCRFAGLSAEVSNPPPVDASSHCSGAHGTKYVDARTGAVTWRWRACVRAIEWGHRRNAWLRAGGGTMKRAARTAPAGLVE